MIGVFLYPKIDMKKIFSIIALSLSTLGFGQEVLDSITVAINRASSPFNEAMREVNVITQSEIEKAPLETINEMLEYSSGVDVRQRGGFDIQSDVSVRGGTFEQTLILLNGMKMNDPQTGHHNMNLPISYDLIEQVEVLQGGASRVYGPNAFAGAINFRTRRDGETMLGARMMGGQYGLFQAAVYGALKGKKHYTLISLDHVQSDGFRYNTDFVKDNVYIQSVIEAGENKLIVNGGFNSKAFGAQTFYSANFPDQFEATQTQFASAIWEGKAADDKLRYDIKGSWRRHYDRFELFRETGDGFYVYDSGLFIKGTDTAGTWYSDHNYHRTDVRELEGNASYNFEKFGQTSFGLDYRHEQIVSSALGMPLQETIEVPGDGRGMYTKGDLRENYSVFVEHMASIGKFNFSAGVLVNYNTAFGEDFMPGLDVSYRVSPEWLLYGSYNKSFRFPTFTDLYYNLGGAKGSSTLKPEYSHNYELGIKRSVGNTFFGVSVFRRAGKDMIDWVQYAPDSIYAENITEINMNGVSVQYGIHSFENISWLNTVSVSYNFLFNDNLDAEYPSLYVLDYLTHKFGLNVNHGFGLEGLTMDWRFNIQDRNGEYYNAIEGANTPYALVALIDAKLNYHVNKFDFFVEASNLLNQDYVDRGNVYQPGVWVRGGIAVKFEKK